MPAAIDEIRKLGKQHHEIFASDTFWAAPGSHSKYVSRAHVTAWPKSGRRFTADVATILREDRIELVLPAFEEAFCLSRHRSELPRSTRLFAPEFDTLRRLHHKASLLELASGLGIRVPRTILARDRSDLVRAMADMREYLARPAYSRGGVQVLTNTGPNAFVLGVDECEPTAENPWIVQEFVHGVDVCTFSVAHGGRITGHSAYVHPREIEHTGGIVFESVHEPEALRVAQKIVEATGYDGQIAFDLMKTPRGMVLIECNPRPTAGVHVMSPEMFEAALFDWEGRRLRLAEPGVRRKYSAALLRNMVLHWRELPIDLSCLLSSAREVFVDPGDPLPALYQVLSYGQVMKYRRDLRLARHGPRDLMAAYFYDVCWNGESIG